MIQVKPTISLLTAEHIESIFQNALLILEKPGIKVEAESARKVFSKALGSSRVNEQWVTIPKEIVRWAVTQSPSKVELYDRNGESAFTIGDGNVHCGIGVTALYYQNPTDDNLILFGRKHVRDLVKIANILPNYEVISTPGVVQDVPVQHADILASLEMSANTKKPLVILISDGDQFIKTLDMFEDLFGDLKEKPSIVPYLNPVTPLVLNADTTGKLSTTIDRGLPVIYSNYALAGMTSPINPEGILSILLAELLAGIVLSQLRKPGSAIIVGMLPAYFDMKMLSNFYDPMSFLINIACSEIMAYLKLPHCGTSGSGTGWGADLIAASSYWMNYLTYFLSKGGLAPFVGDSLGSKSISPKTLVYVHEVIEQSRRFSNGFTLDNDQSFLEELSIAAKTGSFITAPSTLKEYHKAYYSHPFFKNLTMEKWQATGQPTADKILSDYTIELMDKLEDDGSQIELINRGEAFIRKLGNK